MLISHQAKFIFVHVQKTAGRSFESVLRRNSSRHGHYSEWYSDRTRDIVGERYSRDIEAFGYRFECL